MNTNDFLRMFAYDHWANRECLHAMRAKPNTVPTTAIGRMAHILSAEKLWLDRLRQQKQTMPVWPSATIEECKELSSNMASAWRSYLAELGPDDLATVVEYRNSKGEPWSSRVEDILMHVLMHSAYHRGQVALEMRAAGMEPASTDFIHAVRQGFVQ